MIGVLGGTFDPIHLGHVGPALDVLRALALDQIHFVLAAVPPHRHAPHVSTAHRWRMLQLGLQAHPNLLPDDREMRRDGPSYTVETLRELRAQLGAQTLCLIMGNDVFGGCTSWYGWLEILQLAHVTVTTRPGSRLPEHGAIAALLRERGCRSPSALAQNSHGKILPCAVRPMDISATAIRAGLKAGKDVSAMLPEPVWRYIRDNGLYTQAISEAKTAH
jgi:nicotinate-nucleotide adenylyltransferase